MPIWLETLGWIADNVAKLPRWGQPAAWGALAFGSYSAVKVLMMVPRLGSSSKAWLTVLAGAGLSISIGASLGLLYGAYREVRERRGEQRVTKDEV